MTPHAPAIEFADPQIVPAAGDAELELLGMFAACIEPKLGGQLMKRLGPAAPLTGLQHLKRVRKSERAQGKLEVLLCPAPAVQGSSLPAASNRGGVQRMS